MSQRKPILPDRSAPWIVWGIILMILGQLVFGYGQYRALMGFLSPVPYEAGNGAVILGALVVLVGLVIGTNGVGRLARNVDDLAKRAAIRDFDERTAAEEARAQRMAQRMSDG